MRPRSLLRLALTGITSNPLRSWLVGRLRAARRRDGPLDGDHLARRRGEPAPGPGATGRRRRRRSSRLRDRRRGRPTARQRDEHLHAARRRGQHRGGARRGRRLSAALSHVDGELLVLRGVADVHVRLRSRHRLHHRAVAQGEARPRPRDGPGGRRLGRLRPGGRGQDQAVRLRLRSRRQSRADRHQPRPDAVHDLLQRRRDGGGLAHQGEDGAPGPRRTPSRR